ncbi:MAG: DUF1552 domain-containing protein [Lentisphaeraceae bacterium]|nr:DUF1552 domain-containing protein [Lentisphaeraceae bacterium]
MTTNFTNRREFLRGGIACLSLPFLPSLMRAEESRRVNEKIKKACFINMGNGLLARNFFPEKPGVNFKPSRYIQQFGDLKKKMTIFKGLSHQGIYDHYMEHCILTGVFSGKKYDKRSKVSLDTVFAERLSSSTRFPLLSAWPFPGSHYKTPSISYERSGLPVTPTKTPMELYNKLFVKQNASAQEKARIKQNILRDKSILDSLTKERESLKRRMNIADKQIIDEYYEAIRSLEKSIMKTSVEASNKKLMAHLKTAPEVFKGVVTLESLEVIQTQIYDMLYIALMTDTTNVVSMHYPSDDQPLNMIHPDGVRRTKSQRSAFSHHGNNPDRLKGMTQIEDRSNRAMASFCKKLNTKNVYGQTLLDNTMVFCSSNLGNSTNHNGDDLPIMLLGAGFEKDHDHYYDLSKDKGAQTPLCNLFQSMLHKIGDQGKSFNVGNGHLDLLKS